MSSPESRRRRFIDSMLNSRYSNSPDGLAQFLKRQNVSWDPAVEMRRNPSSGAEQRWVNYNARLYSEQSAPRQAAERTAAEREVAQVRQQTIERRRKGLAGLITTSLLGVLGTPMRGGRRSLLGD